MGYAPRGASEEHIAGASTPKDETRDLTHDTGMRETKRYTFLRRNGDMGRCTMSVVCVYWRCVVVWIVGYCDGVVL